LRAKVSPIVCCCLRQQGEIFRHRSFCVATQRAFQILPISSCSVFARSCSINPCILRDQASQVPPSCMDRSVCRRGYRGPSGREFQNMNGLWRRLPTVHGGRVSRRGRSYRRQIDASMGIFKKNSGSDRQPGSSRPSPSASLFFPHQARRRARKESAMATLSASRRPLQKTEVFWPHSRSLRHLNKLRFSRGRPIRTISSTGKIRPTTRAEEF
jgi:hypothetical protein